MQRKSNGVHRTSIAGRIALAGGIALFAAVALLANSPTVSRADESTPTESARDATNAVSALEPTNASVLLAYKFQAGQFAHYESANRVQYLAQLDERRFETVQHNESGMHFRVVSVDEHGVALIEPVIDRARMTAKLPGKEPVVFDSTADEPAPPEFRVIRESLGRPAARFQVAPNGKLIKAIIVDANAPQAMRDAAEKLDTRFPFLVVMPASPVGVGDKWKENYNTSILIGKSLKQPVPLLRLYEVTGIGNGVATIKFKTVVLAPLDDPEHEKQIVQQTPSGTIEFDIERGLVRSHSSALNKTIINALGPQTLLHVVGESTEKLVLPAEDSEQPRVSQNAN